MKNTLIMLVCFFLGVTVSLSEPASNVPVESVCVDVMIQGQRVFGPSRGEYRIKRRISANEVFYFFRTLGAFELKQGDVQITRKIGDSPEEVIVFPVCKLVVGKDGDKEMDLKTGDILTAREPDF